MEDKIKMAFFSIMEENIEQRITMSGIAKRAGIARSTLYQYFDDLNALLGAVSYDYAQALFRMIREGRSKESGFEGFHYAYYTIVQYAHSRKQLLRQLLKNPNFTANAEQALRELLFEDYLKMQLPVHREAMKLCACYLASGGISIFRDWINSDSEKSIQEDADLLLESLLVMRSVLSF